MQNFAYLRVTHKDPTSYLQDDVYTRQFYYREGLSESETFKLAPIESFMLHSVSNRHFYASGSQIIKLLS